MDFAAAQCTRGAVEREITDANFAKIIEARTNLIAQHLSGLVVRQNLKRAQNMTSIGNRERLEFGECEKHFRRGARNNTRGRVRSPDFVIQRVGLIAPAIALGTFDVCAIPAEQNTHVHFIGLALEPAKKTAHAIPAIMLIIFIGDAGVTAPGYRLAFDNEILIGLGQFLERQINIDLFARAGTEQILLRFAKLGTAKNAHHTLFNGQAPIRDGLVKVDRNCAPKAATLRTRAEWIIKSEKTGRRRANI